MSETSYGGWHDYSWVAGAICPATPTGTLALGFVPSAPMGNDYGIVAIEGFTSQFTMIDLTEIAQHPDSAVSYRGGIQSVDKSFSASPINIPIPEQLAVGTDIGFVESAVITIAGVWFDGLNGRDRIMEDIRTTKKIIDERFRQSPLVFLLSNRAYFVMLTGYSSNILGGQGDIISIRLGLSICSGQGHYGT